MKAIPALVVAMAGNPASSKMRALATSQTLGRIRMRGPAMQGAEGGGLGFLTVEIHI